MSESVHFEMKGPILKKSIPLDIALTGLNNLQSILNKSYLAISENKRISKSTREEFKITFTEINHSSVNVDLDFVMPAIVAAQHMMPFAIALSPTEIWNLTKESFGYLKFALESISNGKNPTYKQDGEGNMIVHNGDGDITINQITYNVARDHYSNYQELAKLTKKGVNRICLDKDKDASIKIDESNSDIFIPKAKIMDETIQLTCEIFDFNKHKNGGKIYVPSNQPIPEGDYNFELVGEQEIAPYIHSMLRAKVKINCLQEISSNPFGTTNVLRLKVISIKQ
jgi:hypothetical protein